MTAQHTAIRTLFDALRSVAMQRSEAAALIFGPQEISYEELVHRVEYVAAHLRALGVRRGESVAAYAQNSPEMVYCFLACAKLGAVFVPVNFNLTSSEVDYILSHSDAKVVFTDHHVADISGLTLPKCAIRPMTELGSLTTGQVDDESSVVLSDDLLIAYTSGSTATPKSVVLDHQSQLNVAESLRGFWELSEADTTVVGAPFGFLLGLTTVTMATLLRGGTVVIHRRFHPGETLEALVQHRATIYNGVPTMFEMMLEFAEQHRRTFDLSHMRALISSGAPMPDELRRRFAQTFGNEPQNYFGMTECYPLFGRYTSDRTPMPAGAAGRIAPGAEIAIADETGNSCAMGVQGELHVRGPATIKRYHKNPELTTASFCNGKFRTGDLGYLDGSGYVYLTGRAKDIIKRGGSNVAPAEVEGILLQHPAVQSVAVVGAPDRKFGEIPVAFVVQKGTMSVSAEELAEFAGARLAKFKVPAEFRFLSSLPLGKTGKVDKNQLKATWAPQNSRT